MPVGPRCIVTKLKISSGFIYSFIWQLCPMPGFPENSTSQQVGREQEIVASLCRLVQTGRRLMQPHSHTCWECLRKRPVAPRSHVIVSCAVARKTAVANGVKRRPVYFHASSSHTFSAANLRPQPLLEPYSFTNLRAR